MCFNSVKGLINNMKHRKISCCSTNNIDAENSNDTTTNLTFYDNIKLNCTYPSLDWLGYDNVNSLKSKLTNFENFLKKVTRNLQRENLNDLNLNANRYELPNNCLSDFQLFFDNHVNNIKKRINVAKQNKFNQIRNSLGELEFFAYSMKSHNVKNIFTIGAFDTETMEVPLDDVLRKFIVGNYKQLKKRNSRYVHLQDNSVAVNITADNILIPTSLAIYVEPTSTNLTNMSFSKNNIKVFHISSTTGTPLELYKKSLVMYDDFITYIEKFFSSPEWNNCKVVIYSHNGIEFDQILLMRALLHRGVFNKRKPMWRVKYQKNKPKNISFGKNVVFKDSYKIFKDSLNNLGKTLANETKLDFISGKQTLAMVQKTFADPMLFNQYQDYLIQDCYLLVKVMSIARKYFFDYFQLDITQKNTIASIAVHIFYSKYYKAQRSNVLKNTENLISFNKPNQEEALRQAFYGGRCEIFIPKLEKSYKYDINSAYPFVMQAFDMPLGDLSGPYPVDDPIGFGLYELQHTFGFLKCRVYTHPEMKHVPILPFRSNTMGTIFPTGTFEGWWFSEEIKYAQQCGYIVEVLEVIYAAPQKSCFFDFVNDIYNLRLKNPKPSPLNYIFKIILNSVFGRFGIHIDNIITKVVFSTSTVDAIRQKHALLSEEYINLPNGKKAIIVVYAKKSTKYKKGLQKEINRREYSNARSAIHISAAITAYNRLYGLGLLKPLARKQLAYTDTDSFIIGTKLPSTMISDKTLGFLKLEVEAKETICLHQKMYAYEIENPVTKETSYQMTVAGVTTEQKAKLNKIKFNEFLKNPSATSVSFNQAGDLNEQLFTNPKTCTISSRLVPRTLGLAELPNGYNRVYNEHNVWDNTASIVIVDGERSDNAYYSLLYKKQIERLIAYKHQSSYEKYYQTRIKYYAINQKTINTKNKKTIALIDKSKTTKLSKILKQQKPSELYDNKNPRWKTEEKQLLIELHKKYNQGILKAKIDLSTYFELRAKWVNSERPFELESNE